MATTLKSFRKTAVITFGRFNPPTIGHEKLIRTVFQKSKELKADPIIFLSQSQDPKKNPLTGMQKAKWIRLGLPPVGSAIKSIPTVRTIFDAMFEVVDMGYTDVVLVVGDDRVSEFKRTITPYVNHPDKSKSLDLNSFKVVSAGKRSDSSHGIEGVSASKMRAAAANDDFESFSQMTMTGLSPKFKKELFKDIQRGMHISSLIEALIPIGGKYKREELPQIRKINHAECLRYLTNNNISYERLFLPVSDIKFTQTHVDEDKVKRLVDLHSESSAIDFSTEFPLFVSNDYFLVDGHHRVFAQKVLNNSQPICCIKVHQDITMLKKTLHDFLLQLKEETKTGNERPTEVEAERERQNSEKEFLKKKQDSQLAAAREKDFRNKERERSLEAQKKEAERKAQANEELLEIGTDEIVADRIANVPDQRIEKALGEAAGDRVGEPYTPLLGHYTPETAYVVDDYPYGFTQRTSIRYWIERKPGKGSRFVSQTLNPKTNRWNSPKASVYDVGGFMYKDNKGFVGWKATRVYGDSNEIDAYADKYKKFLDPEEYEVIKNVAKNRRMRGL